MATGVKKVGMGITSTATTMEGGMSTMKLPLFREPQVSK
jgi:hypothetical protein